MNWKICLVVAAGGAIGTVGRFALAYWAAPISQSLPWGTILINILGSFVIGFFGTLTLTQGRYPLGEEARLFVMVGLCGGFTTFSSFSLQTLDLMRAGAYSRALTNIGISVVLCIAAVALGHALAARINGGSARIAQVEAEELG